MKITFLGGGNMAGALIGGLLAKGADARSLSVIEVSPTARERLAARHAVHISTAPDAALQGSDVLVLAVKPQNMRSALASVSGFSQEKLVVSIAAGIPLAALSRWLGGHRRIVRCMPNTPALIGAGITALFAPAEVDAQDKARAETILRAAGEIVWVPEERLLDPVTALSGSGPAYVFWFIEQLAASGQQLGLNAETSLKLALQTVLGAAKLAASSGEPVETLRKNVTSKGGTTEAALKVFDEEKLAERFARALQAASRRGTELGAELGKDDVLSQIGIFLVDTVVTFIVFLLLARFHFQWLRAPFRNPVGEFVLAGTNWAVMPARRVVPGVAGLDLASLLLAWVAQTLGLWAQIAIAGAQPALGAVIAVAAVDLLRYSLYILVFAVIVQAVLSWVNPYTPFAPVFDALTRPFLKPIRRFVPLLGQFDISPLILLILLQVLLIPVGHLRGAAATI